MRLPADLARRLKIRVASDKTDTRDYGLAAAHYLNAALSQIPTDTPNAAEWGLNWRARSGASRTPTIGSGYRLHRDTADRMHDLGIWLPTLDIHPNAWEVMAEALFRFLEDLDRADKASQP